MEFQAKLTFEAQALPEAIRQEYLGKLVRQKDQSQPVVVDGIKIYRTRAPDSLETIALMKARGKDVSSPLYIVMDKLHGDEPSWLRAIHPVKVNIGPIEFDKDLGVAMKVGPAPHGGGTEISMVIDDWRKANLLLGPFVLLGKGRTCSKCGSIITMPNGTVVVDPRIQTCPDKCT